MKSSWKELFTVLKLRTNELYSEKLRSASFLVASWRMVLFISGLAVLVIFSSHKMDRKVVRINKLNEELKDLRSRHIDLVTHITSLSKPTRVAKEVQHIGLYKSIDAPFKIEIKN